MLVAKEAYFWNSALKGRQKSWVKVVSKKNLIVKNLWKARRIFRISTFLSSLSLKTSLQNRAKPVLCLLCQWFPKNRTQQLNLPFAQNKKPDNLSAFPGLCHLHREQMNISMNMSPLIFICTTLRHCILAWLHATSGNNCVVGFGGLIWSYCICSLSEVRISSGVLHLNLISKANTQKKVALTSTKAIDLIYSDIWSTDICFLIWKNSSWLLPSFGSAQHKCYHP